MRMGRVTVQEIANRAGVSKSTVSRALNNSGYVSEDVKQQILQIAQESAYKNIRVAAKASKDKQPIIGVMFPALKSDFFGRILEGITAVADENGCGIMLFSTNDDSEREIRQLKMLRELKVQGLIITPMAAYQAMEGWNLLQTELDALNIPVVLVDRNVKKSNWDSISFDNFNGAYLIGETLAAEEHTRIGAIIGDTCLQLGIDRMNGFVQALKMNHLDVDPGFFFTDKKIITSDMAYRYTVRAIQEKRLPEAVFLSNTLVATGFFKALFSHGLMPGRDVRCIGFDYIDALDVLDFEYTYLERETFETGKMAMQMLLDRFEQEIASRREYITPAKFANY